MKEGELTITVSLLIAKGGTPRQFDIVCDPETMSVYLEEDMVSLTNGLDPNEDPDGAARTIIEAIENAGPDLSMDGMEKPLGRLLKAVVEATP